MHRIYIKIFLSITSILITLKPTVAQNTVIQIPLPPGYVRPAADKGTFPYYLRHIKLSKHNIVYYYNGQKKPDQSANYAVLEIDIGNRDLQQCADAVMRLWGEYLYSTGQYEKIYFNFLSDGKPRYFTDYAHSDYSYKKFRKYMDYVFAFANTSSLYDQLQPVNINQLQAGDVFIQKGRPYGHAIIVIDIAINPVTGQKIMLLAQSFMPAQSIHILVNPTDPSLSPWYAVDSTAPIFTPDWTFYPSDLRRFVIK